MFHYKFVNSANFDIDTESVDTIFKLISKNIDKKQNATLNIVFLDNESIKNLNNKYRKIDKATDVLSFHYFDDFSGLQKEDIAGEIVMSEQKIISQAKQYKHSEEKEFYKLLIHSVLHILGFDHEKDDDYKQMVKFEKKIWKDFFEN